MGRQISGAVRDRDDAVLHEWLFARINAMPREARSALVMFLHLADVEAADGAWDIMEDGSIKLSLQAREEWPDD